MTKCDFCKNNFTDDFLERWIMELDGFVISIPRTPYHEYHLLIFDSRNHVGRLNLYTDERIVALKNLINKLDAAFNEHLLGYQGYNLTSNNGEEEIGQRVQHAHTHLFMRHEGESESPFVRMNTNNPVTINGNDIARIKTTMYLESID